MSQSENKLSHILTHLAEDREHYYNAVTPPIIQSSNFVFNSIEQMFNKFECEMDSHLYTRGNNPTVQILRKKLAALEGTQEALMFASGSAAMSAAIMSQVSAGDHIISVKKPYGWTQKLLAKFLPRFGVTCTFVDGTDPHNFEQAWQKNTKTVVLESPNSWTFELQDLEAVSTWAKQKQLTTIIDNSYCSPLAQQPAKFGIDIIVHSATKYLSGHSDVVAGVLCTSRAQAEKIFANEYMTMGGVQSPHDAASLLKGLRTLPLRYQRSSETTTALCDWLASHPKVKRLIYPFHKSFPQYELAKKQMSQSGGLLTVEFDCEQTVRQLCERSKAFLIAVSWGGYESLMMPALGLGGKTSGTLPEGLNRSMVRFYVGLEDLDFLKADLSQSLGD